MGVASIERFERAHIFCVVYIFKEFFDVNSVEGLRKKIA